MGLIVPVQRANETVAWYEKAPEPGTALLVLKLTGLMMKRFSVVNSTPHLVSLHLLKNVSRIYGVRALYSLYRSIRQVKLVFDESERTSPSFKKIYLIFLNTLQSVIKATKALKKHLYWDVALALQFNKKKVDVGNFLTGALQLEYMCVHLPRLNYRVVALKVVVLFSRYLSVVKKRSIARQCFIPEIIVGIQLIGKWQK